MDKIGIRYIDTRASTTRALRDFRNMRWKIENAKGQIDKIGNHMASPKVSSMSSTPIHWGGSRTEDKWIRGIEKMDLLERGLLDAQEYMDWFMPRWGQLTDEEKLILSERFMSDHRDRGAWVEVICRQIHYARPTVYLKSEEALTALAGLLFW